MCSYSVTIGTNDVTFRYLRLHPSPGEARLACGDRQIETFDLAGSMVKIHHVGWVSATAVSTRHVLGIANSSAVALNPTVLQFEVISLVLLVIITLVSAVTQTAPVLRFAIRANPKLGQEQTPLTFRTFLRGHLPLLTERVMGIEPTSVAWKATALPLSYTR